MSLPGFIAERSSIKTGETYLEKCSRYSERTAGTYDKIVPMGDCYDLYIFCVKELGFETVWCLDTIAKIGC
jgi:hypothetical protein